MTESTLTTLERLPGLHKGSVVSMPDGRFLITHIMQKETQNADGTLSLTFILVAEPLFTVVDRELN